MALIKCSECGKEISDKAAACIGCGAPIAIAVAVEPSTTVSSKEKVSSLRSIPNSVWKTVSSVSTAAKNLGGMVATQVGDLNGDGKIDAEDFKIAAAKTKQMVSVVADEAVKLGKDALQSDLVKDAAAGAAIGAVVAIPVPIIGPVAGAAVGAGMGVYKNITKK